MLEVINGEKLGGEGEGEYVQECGSKGVRRQQREKKGAHGGVYLLFGKEKRRGRKVVIA